MHYFIFNAFMSIAPSSFMFKCPKMPKSHKNWVKTPKYKFFYHFVATQGVDRNRIKLLFSVFWFVWVLFSGTGHKKLNFSIIWLPSCTK